MTANDNEVLNAMTGTPETPSIPPSDVDQHLRTEFRLKRLQRAIEYTLLIVLHATFLIAFYEYYQWYLIAAVVLLMSGMSLQLTLLRESRRNSDEHNVSRIKADTLESLLFLLFVATISAGRFLAPSLFPETREYLAYTAAIFCGLFSGALAGETYWQQFQYPELPPARKRNYISNLKRTIILPYLAPRRK